MLVKALRVVMVLSLIVAASVLVTSLVQAHGAMQTPMSRVYSCFLENPESPDTLPCRDAIAFAGTQALYDWNEVNIRDVGGQHQARIPDGQLCSAGRPKYAGFDVPRLDWPVTVLPASGNFTFNFIAAVPHNFGHFELYVTRNGWDPLQPLKWSDLDSTPFLNVNEPPLINGAYIFSGPLPTGKSGRHLIYTIWQRHDSQEAFYSCSDVWFGPSPTPAPTNPPPCTAPAWNSTIVYQGGAEVNHGGRLWRAKWSNASTEPSSVPNVNPWEIIGYCSGTGGPTPTRTNTPVGPTPTPTRTNTPPPPTATPTRTNTPVGPTPTRTNTPVGPTPTRTNTPIGPTPTRTNTPVGPTPTRTNTPVVTGGCTVTYTVNDWNNGGGFTGSLVIRNNGTAAINGWTLTWTYANQRVDHGWEATITQPGGAGTAVSAASLSHNASIGPNGGTRSFGFNATYFGTNPRPATFTLNGTACTVQ
jgi:predicted carbohydrate-binding protein with CBM5 and CBM33 domain